MSKEIWKDVVGYEGHYKVSSKGRIKSLKRIINYTRLNKPAKRIANEKILKLTNPYGSSLYVRVCLKGKNEYLVHRLVAEAFIENINKKEYVNHKNFIKTDNRVENLEWVTAKENNIHYFSSKESKRSDGTQKSSKFTKKEITEIRKRYENGETQTSLGPAFGVSQSHIHLIVSKKQYSNI